MWPWPMDLPVQGPTPHLPYSHPYPTCSRTPKERHLVYSSHWITYGMQTVGMPPLKYFRNVVSRVQPPRPPKWKLSERLGLCFLVNINLSDKTGNSSWKVGCRASQFPVIVHAMVTIIMMTARNKVRSTTEREFSKFRESDNWGRFKDPLC